MSLRSDWPGEWFPIMEKLGEFTGIPFGFLKAGHSDPEWIFVPHRHHDGVGAVLKLCRERGYPEPSLPVLSNPRLPSPANLLRAFFRFLNDSRVRKRTWKTFNPLKNGRQINPSWVLFTEKETKVFVDWARGQNISLNTFLLRNLDLAALPLQADPATARKWLIPVNMRGGVTRSSPLLNHASYVSVEITPESTYSTIHKAVRREVSLGMHWFAWWSVFAGRIIGTRGMEGILQHYHANAHGWTGTFSNLGPWTTASGTTVSGENESLLFAPVVTRGHPIAAGAVTWNGRLGLALLLHPALSESPEEVQGILNAWKANCIKETHEGAIA